MKLITARMALLATTASVLLRGVINVTLSVSLQWLTSVWGILIFTLAPKQQWCRPSLISRGCRQPELHSVTSITVIRGTLLPLIFILPVMVLRNSGNFYLYRKNIYTPDGRNVTWKWCWWPLNFCANYMYKFSKVMVLCIAK